MSPFVKPDPAVVVVGGGPCGVAAAIQLSRGRIPTLLFEERAVGGLLHNAFLVENYPGFSRGISGPALCHLLERHLHAAGVRPIEAKVTEILPVQNGFEVRSTTGGSVIAGAVIVATGTRPIKGILPREEALPDQKIFYEIRDVPEPVHDRRAAIIGGSDAAYDYALNLASRGCAVTIVQRSRPRCLPLLAERVGAAGGIAVLENTVVKDCREDGVLLRLVLDSGQARRTLDADFLLIACGREPADALLHPLKEAGEKGIFTGGDLTRGSFRQAGIAVGDGLTAAMSAMAFLQR